MADQTATLATNRCAIESIMKDTVVGYPGDFADAPVPKRPRLSANFICTVEWSWSPAHSRQDRYSLHVGPSHWLLYLSYWDDIDAKVHHDVIGLLPKGSVDVSIVAAALVWAFWKYDSDVADLDRFHLVDEVGLLNREDVAWLADQVWGS